MLPLIWRSDRSPAISTFSCRRIASRSTPRVTRTRGVLRDAIRRQEKVEIAGEQSARQISGNFDQIAVGIAAIDRGQRPKRANLRRWPLHNFDTAFVQMRHDVHGLDRGDETK